MQGIEVLERDGLYMRQVYIPKRCCVRTPVTRLVDPQEISVEIKLRWIGHTTTLRRPARIDNGAGA